jgi:hypothetical protein
MKTLRRTILSVAALFLGISVGQAQFSAPIILPGDTTLAPPAGDQTKVAFARGAGTTLMVWEDRRADLTMTQSSQGTAVLITDIYAARIDDAGNTLDTPPIVVTHAAFAQTVPKVAWNGQNWLVVWTSRTPGPSFSTQGVYGARISASGQILDDPPIMIADTLGFDEREPVVASDGNNWGVIWFANIAFGTDGVRGCLVNAAGATDAPRTFFQTAGGVSYYVPFNFQLAWAGGRYMLVSEHLIPGPTSDQDILGQFFDASLTKIGSEFSVAANTPWDQRRAAIASNGAGFFVTWYDEELPGQARGSPVSSTGVVAVPNGVVFESAVDEPTAAGWDGANWIAAWARSGFSSSEIHVARVSGAGAMLPGSPFAVSAGSWSKYFPAVAALNGRALVAWSDERNVSFSFSNAPFGIDTTDLYGAVVDVSGSATPDRALLLSPPAQTRPDLAGNSASGYLVTFLSETAGTGSVMAQRVNAFGAPIDPQPSLVATGSRLIRNPAVAFDGTLWLVTWEDSGNVLARRVGANGIPIGAGAIPVMSGNTPDVAAVAGTFLVVSTTTPSHFQSIHGARVRGSDGAVLDASPIFIGSYYSLDPAVTAIADRWLVAWEQHPTHSDPNSSIQASLVLSNGTTLGQFVAGASGRAPSVTGGGSTALVSWNGSSDIQARRIRSDGTLLDTGAGFVVSNAFNKQFAPESGWNGVSWFVAWNDFRAHTSLQGGGVGDVFGSGVDANGTVLDPTGLAVADDFRVPECNPAVAGDLGSTIQVFASVHDEAPYGTFRISLRGECGVPVLYCTAKTNSLGCVPAIGSNGTPSASSGSGFVVTGVNVRNRKNGLLFYGVTGRVATPFQGGTLCVKGPVQRTPAVNSGGTPLPANDCSGVYALDFNAFITGGTASPALQVPGTLVNCQWWGRDPGFPPPNNTALSDALEFSVCQ